MLDEGKPSDLTLVYDYLSIRYRDLLSEITLQSRFTMFTQMKSWTNKIDLTNVALGRALNQLASTTRHWPMSVQCWPASQTRVNIKPILGQRLVFAHTQAKIIQRSVLCVSYASSCFANQWFHVRVAPRPEVTLTCVRKNKLAIYATLVEQPPHK